MTEYTRPLGKTTIAPDVLLTIVRLAALSVPGVNRLTTIPGTANRIFKRPENDGVKISVENNTVYADVYMIVNKDVNVRDVCRNVQTQVSRAISEMVGMDVARINIHVEDVEYDLLPEV
ncbi:MAG TPA: Asp23/Gls24 family envelope stress response protein [Anaerolineaceae bacterium]|nr:Asp23/Gls24 family envelope stress response protein [Anaerolineaceae bacterium]